MGRTAIPRREFITGALLLAALAGCSRAVPGSAAVTATGTPTPARVGELRGAGQRLTAGRPAAGAFGDFSTGLFKATATDGNCLLSPYSVLSALGMTALGSAGVTQQRLRTLFGGDAATVAGRLTSVDSALAAAVKSGNSATGKAGQTVIDTANSVFTDAGLKVHQQFLDALVAGYGAGLQTLDFARDPEGSRSTINRWVAQRTADLIPELLSPGDITVKTKLALVNAIHLKAPWADKFSTAVAAPFHPLDGSTVSVPMMRRQDSLPYASGDGWRAVSVPYAGRALAMTIILPDAGSFDEVRSALDGDLLTATQSGESTLLDLRLPKFAVEFRSDLLPNLDRMEAGPVFQPSDLSGISGAPGDLEVSAVIHQAKITVDEDGTEAAAATAVVVASAGAAPNDEAPQPIEFVVDRPFLFCVHDTATLTPLFFGQVIDPTH